MTRHLPVRVRLAGLALLPLTLAACGTAASEPGASPAAGPSASAAGPSSAASPSSATSPSAAGTAATSASPTPEPSAAPPEATKQLAEDLGEDTKLPATGGSDYAGYRTLTRDGGAFSFEAPTDWVYAQSTTVRGQPALSTGLSRRGFEAGTQAGLVVQLTTGTPESALQTYRARGFGANCTGKGSVNSYDDGTYSGLSQAFTGCDGDGTAAYLALKRTGTTEDSALVTIDATLVADRDIAAVARVVRTFRTAS